MSRVQPIVVVLQLESHHHHMNEIIDQSTEETNAIHCRDQKEVQETGENQSDDDQSRIPQNHLHQEQDWLKYRPTLRLSQVMAHKHDRIYRPPHRHQHHCEDVRLEEMSTLVSNDEAVDVTVTRRGERASAGCRKTGWTMDGQS